MFTSFISVLSILACLSLYLAQEIYVCEAENAAFLGTYVKGRQQQDGSDVFSNENDRSFFRNKGFWYLGDLAPWPPETHYRCVEAEGCSYNEDIPPSSSEGKWKGNRAFNSERPPIISTTPCPTTTADEL